LATLWTSAGDVTVEHWRPSDKAGVDNEGDDAGRSLVGGQAAGASGRSWVVASRLAVESAIAGGPAGTPESSTVGDDDRDAAGRDGQAAGASGRVQTVSINEPAIAESKAASWPPGSGTTTGDLRSTGGITGDDEVDAAGDLRARATRIRSLAVSSGLAAIPVREWMVIIRTSDQTTERQQRKLQEIVR
jgi:hypothetical protein